MHPRDISRVVHEANRAIQAINSDPINVEWDDLNDELKFSTYDGVKTALAGASPKELHEQWVRDRHAAGWTWGSSRTSERSATLSSWPTRTSPQASAPRTPCSSPSSTP